MKKDMLNKNSNRKPLILVTNDDGYFSKGLESLIEMAKPFGRLVVVAPEEGQSGMSHAITITKPLRIRKHNRNDEVEVFSVNGTPVDCVKLAMSQILANQPDLIISGVNHGSNASVSIVYSGTMAAVIEGCLYGIPSIGFSLLDFMPDADFTGVIEYGKPVIDYVLKNGLRNGVCLNVNFPAIPKLEIKGITVCRQNKGTWREEFDKRTDPRGKEYFWLTGHYQNEEPNATDTDEHALANGFVSVVPVNVDFTDKQELLRLNQYPFNEYVSNEKTV